MEGTLDSRDVEADPLADRYRQSITPASRPQRSLAHQHAALLCIDMQFLDAARGHGVFAPGRPEAASPAAQDYYFERLERVVLPNVGALQACFRTHGLEVIHARIQSLTRDGRDRSPGHKRLELLAPPGSKEAEFLPEIAPVGDEIVINKTASGIFTATNARYILANLGVTALYVVGVYTNECVSTTVRDACDLGFDVTLIEDGCATVSRRLHRNTLAVLRDRYARVGTTAEVIAEVNRLCQLASP
ncbi:isochorismatase family cysteine hydrolase [Enhygromyxa salina]|uniref:isochorismatase family cysteine hydrolase n=1 Tax=Enhygromyxa salina TaxID=215803 RepID=UPI000D0937F8